MKKFALITMVALFVAATFSSCGKYEEGPKVSLRTKKARLSNEWKVEKTESSTGTVYTPDANNTTVSTFEKDGTLTSTSKYTFLGTTYTSTYSGTWEFDGKTDLKTTYTSTDNGTTTSTTTTSEIIKLKSDELILKDKDGNKTYFVPNE